MEKRNDGEKIREYVFRVLKEVGIPRGSDNWQYYSLAKKSVLDLGWDDDYDEKMKAILEYGKW